MKLFSLTLLATLFAAASAGEEPAHIKTWSNQSFEIDGQCDLVMLKDSQFAEGLGLNMHIRTRVVGAWTYIKSAAIKIGDDILEIEGSPNPNDLEPRHWFNSEYQPLYMNMAGLPVKVTKPTPFKQEYMIDLDSKYPGKDITIEVFDQFLRFKFNGDETVFGNSVGLLGDYKSGKSLARDGETEFHNFFDLSAEWQVLPNEPKLFHVLASPQYPQSCLRVDDYLAEKMKVVSDPGNYMYDAEASCVDISDPTLKKECIDEFLIQYQDYPIDFMMHRYVYDREEALLE